MHDQLPEQLETARLRIRVARPGDGPRFNEAVLASLSELSPWLSWVTPAPSVAASEADCRRAHARFLLNEDLMAFFFLKDDGTLVGGSGLHKADWKLRQFEIGYWGRSGYGGRGLMTEGVRALADHALQVLGASRVFLTTDARNERSWRLAERAGFEYEGTLRHDRPDLAGQLRDTRVYARIGTPAAGGDASAAPVAAHALRSPAGASMAAPAPAVRRRIGSGSSFEAEIGYSRAVVQGDWVFVSGTTGFDYTTMTIAAGVAEQAEQALRNIAAALDQAGAAMADVVRVRYILPDAGEFPACWPVLQRWFGGVRPAATMIQAGLMDPRMRIEIEVTALRQPARAAGVAG